ncbi:MAG: VWA domain-containing protein, partial [Chloroflexota bacterium]
MPMAVPTEAPAAAEAEPPSPVVIWPAPAPTAALPPIGAVPTPVDNFFEDYGVNPFIDAYEDHLSTFAVDVDTASYS